MPRTARATKKAQDPPTSTRPTGRKLTARQTARAQAELRVLRRLRLLGSLTSADVRRLARPFPPRRLLQAAQRVAGIQTRKGRDGGLVVKNAERLRGRIRDLETTVASLRQDAAAPTDGEAEIPPPPIRPATPATDGTQPHPFPSDSWQAAAIRFLAARYSASDLHGWLPFDFTEEIYEVAFMWTDDYDRPISAEEVAGWHLIVHGRDLLANCPELRQRVAQDLGVPHVQRFHPGSQGAHEFVQRAGLPPELAGVPDPEGPPAISVLAAHRKLSDLVDYQKQLRKDAFGVMAEGASAMVSSPTGTGKTRIAWEAVMDLIESLRSSQDAAARARNLIVWLAHSNELLDQACACLSDVWHARGMSETALLVRLWGRNTPDALRRIRDLDLPGHDAAIIVSTPATVATLLRDTERAPALRRAIMDRCRLVVVDEAHRAAAPSYREIAEALRPPATAVRSRPVALIGLSATPFRETYSPTEGMLETAELLEIFGRLIVPAGLGRDAQRKLVADGVLAQPVFVDIDTGVELDLDATAQRTLRRSGGGRLTQDQEEALDRELMRLAMSQIAQRHPPVLQAALNAAREPDSRVLCFCPSVANAQVLALQLAQAGIPAAAVHGETRAGTRERLVEEFRSGRLRALCNCEVLTTGFDAPRVTHVVVARPTTSLVLYEQMVGRGLRGPKFGGTARCTILNCIDRVKIGSPVLAHLTFRRLWENGMP